MTSQKLKVVDPLNPDPTLVSEAVSLILGGQLIVAPTETRYGLLGRADRAEIVKRIFRLKGRDLSQPTAIFASGIESVTSFARVDERAERLMKAFWPGPLTLVLEATREFPEGVTSGGRIGVRCSGSPLIARIVETAGVPITATSANLSGRIGDDSVASALEAFGNEVALYLDGGILEGEPSTIVDVTTDAVKMLRLGAIDERAIHDAIGEPA